MGHKVSVVTGVKSENFTKPGNAVNEIWVGNTEVISRLPFAGSDMDQAGWAKDGMPKIPWHNFIIPLKRDVHTIANFTHNVNFSTVSQLPSDKLICCNQDGCISDGLVTKNVITSQLVNQSSHELCNAILWMILPLYLLISPIILHIGVLKYDGLRPYDKRDATLSFGRALFGTAYFVIGSVLAWLGGSALLQSHVAYHVGNVYFFVNPDLLSLALLFSFLVIFHLLIGLWAVRALWKDWFKARRESRRWQDEEVMVEVCEKIPNAGSQSSP
ncbi:hypothetical protein BDV12DRAFT_168302 [Aspergillus spectabilis]